jgi:hypothetical protein
MRAILSAAALSLVLVVLLAAEVMAKGEQAAAVIGPIDDIDAGTPTQVTATLSLDGRAITDGSFPAMLDFYEPVTRVAMDFPLRYDRATKLWSATVTLPTKGRWLVEVVMRQGTGFSESFGSTTGTRVVTVNPAPVAPPAPVPPSPLAIAALGAAVASAAWLLAVGGYAVRRRRVASVAAQPSVGERIPA